jgi:hypothetical protein
MGHANQLFFLIKGKPYPSRQLIARDDAEAAGRPGAIDVEPLT